MSVRRATRVVRSAAVAVALIAAAVAVVGLRPAAAHAASSIETTYLAVMNSERASHGLAPLTMRTTLSGVAQDWAVHMAANNVLAHNPKLATQVTNWRSVGENVGYGPTVTGLADAFWASPMHRANILDPSYNDVGIGAVTRDGLIWITIDFRDPLHTVQASTANRHPVLRQGSRGPAVTRVQHRLHERADGLFGSSTRHAVQRFQHRHDLRVNGVVARRTWAALGI